MLATTKSKSLVCLILLFGAACTGGDPLPGNAPSTLHEADPVLVAQAEVFGFESVPFGSMLEEELEILYQERVRTCMITKGFDYFPVGFGSTRAPIQLGTVTFSDGRSIAHDEMASAFGFGVVEEILIFVRGAEGLKADENLDPNSEYIDSLSGSGKERYWDALHNEEHGRVPVVESSFEKPIVVHDYDESLELAYKDPRIIEFVDTWSSCIQAKGYDFSDPGDPPDFFETEARRIMDDANTRIRDYQPTEWTTALQDLTRALEELQSEEIRVALASESCGGTSYENQRLLDKVVLEIQSQVDE